MIIELIIIDKWSFYSLVTCIYRIYFQEGNNNIETHDDRLQTVDAQQVIMVSESMSEDVNGEEQQVDESVGTHQNHHVDESSITLQHTKISLDRSEGIKEDLSIPEELVGGEFL